MSETRTIANNTIFLYIRMFIIMSVSVLASRVVLDKLGVEDYGLYNVVGGVVGFLSFLNNTLSVGTSRYITYALGNGGKEYLKETFSTASITHLGLAIFILIIMEVVGPYFIFHKLVIPPDRISAAFAVFHLSVFTMVFSVVQIPYTADIMAHEKMGIYAYVGIFEAFGKLLACYLLSISRTDHLVFYAFLMTVLQITVALAYCIYCISHFEESIFSFRFRKDIFVDITKFSSWNILTTFPETLRTQGIVILMNMMFSPVVVGAQAFAANFSNLLNQFVLNFRSAINPQIIKKYAAGHYADSRQLTISTTIYVFDLILLICLPVFFTLPKILDIWLVDVPDYTLFFCRWSIINIIIISFSTAFYVPMMAAGKIRTNSIMSLITGIFVFVALYVVWKFGGGFIFAPISSLVISIILGIIVRPIILVKEVEGYTLKEIYVCIYACLKVTACSIVIPAILYFIVINKETILGNVIVIFACIFSVATFSFLFMSSHERAALKRFVIKTIKQEKV